MISFLKTTGIAKFKYPERLELVKEIPMTVGGKVDTLALHADIVNKMKREGKI